MFFEKNLAIFMGAFVVWGFLMAFFFNLMLALFGAKKDVKLIFVCFITAISYSVSDHFFDFFSGPEIYITWFYYDLVTLALLLPVFFINRSQQLSAGGWYVFVGLSINSLLLLSMHLDIVVGKNYTAWWLWSLYSVGINLLDLMMIVALIVDRDFLGLIYLSRKAKVGLKEAINWLCSKCSLQKLPVRL